MERTDQELLLQVADSNPYLKELYKEHLKLDEEVERLGRFASYSSSAAIRQQELKKQKLRGMDAIMSILNEHREDLS